MTIPAATSDSNYDAATDDPKQARSQLSALQQAYEQTRSFVGGSMGSLTATDAGTLDVDSVDAGTIYVAAQAGSPSPIIDDLGTPTRGAPWKTLVFEAGITIQHAAGSLELPGGVDILTEDGDSAVVVYDTVGSPAFWRVIDYRRAAQAPNALGWTHIQSQTASADTAIDFAIPSGYRSFRLTIDVIASSSGADLEMLVSTDGGSSFINSAAAYQGGRIEMANTTTVAGSGSNSQTQMRIATDLHDVIGNFVLVTLSSPRESGVRTSAFATTSMGRAGVVTAPQITVNHRQNAEDNDAIRVQVGTGNMTGVITLEGLKTS